VDAKYLAGAAYVIAAFAAVWALNWFAARRLDRQIRELEKLENNHE
jgi:HAMP domain-containing protein